MMGQCHIGGFGVGGGGGVNAVDYNGAGDYLSKASDFTGNADSKTGIFSAWFRLDGGNASDLYCICNSTNRFNVIRTASNIFEIRGRDTGASNALLLRSLSTYTSSSSWVNLLASWNLSTAISHLYVNGVSDKDEVVNSNANIDYTDTTWLVGSSPGISAYWNGGMAEVYFAPGQYLDLSNSANRLKFRDALGKPASLGLTGSTPTGTAPILYIKNPASSVNVNSGTGGDFVINGTPSDASTSPSN